MNYLIIISIIMTYGYQAGGLKGDGLFRRVYKMCAMTHKCDVTLACHGTLCGYKIDEVSDKEK